MLKNILSETKFLRLVDPMPMDSGMYEVDKNMAVVSLYLSVNSLFDEYEAFSCFDVGRAISRMPSVSKRQIGSAILFPFVELRPIAAPMKIDNPNTPKIQSIHAGRPVNDFRTFEEVGFPVSFRTTAFTTSPKLTPAKLLRSSLAMFDRAIGALSLQFNVHPASSVYFETPVRVEA